MQIDNTSPFKLASDVAEIIKTRQITPHQVPKTSSFESICDVKQTHNHQTTTCSDPKILMQSHFRPNNTRFIMLFRKRSEDKKKAIGEATRTIELSTKGDGKATAQKRNLGVRTTKSLAREVEALSSWFDRTPTHVKIKTKKRKQKVARKTVSSHKSKRP